MIERQRQLERLVSVMGNGTVKVITGIRRCGKSYLLNTIFRKYLQKQGVRKDHIIAVALDLDEYEELQNPRKLSAYLKKRLKADGKMNLYPIGIRYE